ncbi:MAG: deoxyribodipyrimidine photo-lyase, partial [Corynebacterium casei]|nr:deoxyribodipyrimidine photo-lyase [Corynebacterium casei]
MSNSCGTQQFETLNAQTSSADTTSIVWFRNDLRLTDNSALAAAAAEGNVVALYVVEDPNLTGVRAPGGASNWWLDQSLRDLATRLDTFDIPLLTEHGDPRLALPQLANDLNATFVAWSERYHEPQRSIDSAVKERLETSGIPAHEFPGHLLLEPW